MLYRNTHPTGALKFSFGKEHYTVEVGATVEIPEKWAPWVVSRGLLLVAVAETPTAPTPVVEQPSEPEPEAKPRSKKK